MVGFTGSRNPSPALSNLAATVAKTIHSYGVPVAVGCASGVDKVVRSSVPVSRVFRAAGSQPWQLARRSAFMVGAVAAPSKQPRYIMAFPSSACPAGLVPSSSASACFSGKGSGTWATVAYAVGLGVPVVVFGSAPLPAWGGQWVSFASGSLAGGALFKPAQSAFKF